MQRKIGECKHCKRVDERDGTADLRTNTVKQREEWTAKNIRKAKQEDNNITLLLKC